MKPLIFIIFGLMSFSQVHAHAASFCEEKAVQDSKFDVEIGPLQKHSISKQGQILVWSVQKTSPEQIKIVVADKDGDIVEVSGTCITDVHTTVKLSKLNRTLECDCSADYDDVK